MRLLLIALLVSGCARTIALVGDSTTYGTPRKGTQSRLNPGDSLEALLALDNGPWASAKVINHSVGASNTMHWVQSPPAGCGTLLTAFSVVKESCSRGISWVASVAREEPDLVVVDLGLNDYLVTRNPEETVARLEQIQAALAPVPVVFFPPMAPLDGPREDWPIGVRAAMERRGLFSGQYPLELPTFDGLHPTDGGYAAKAGLWIDRIREIP